MPQGITDPQIDPVTGKPVYAIPTNPDGTQVGSGTEFDPATGLPKSSPTGYHWDPNMGSFEKDGAAVPYTPFAVTQNHGDPTNNRDTVVAGGASGPDWSTDPQWAGLDPRLVALYKKHNITPGPEGSGFTDARYWDNKLKTDPSYDYLSRLDRDLSGTGTDRSTGTIWGAAGAPAGVDSMADNSGYGGGAQLASLAPTSGGFDVTSQGVGPGSYQWRLQQIYQLQQMLANSGLAASGVKK